MLNKKTGWLIAGASIFLLGMIISFIKPDTLVGIINIDLEKKTFSGSMPAVLFVMGGLFVWLGLRETKEDLLASAKKSLEDAANRIAGSVIDLRFRIGPDNEVSELKRLLVGQKLKGEYIVKQKGLVLKRDNLKLFEDPNGGVIMAEVEAVSAAPDTLIEIVVRERDGTRQWRASESVRVRIVNLELEKRS